MFIITYGIESCWDSIVLNAPNVTERKMQSLLHYHISSFMREVIAEHTHLKNVEVHVMDRWRIVKSGIEYTDGEQKIIVGHQHTSLLSSVARHTLREGIVLVRVVDVFGKYVSYLLINGKCQSF